MHAYTNPGKQKKTYSKEDCDYVMGVDLKAGHFAFVPVDRIPRSGNVRVSKKTKVAQFLDKLPFKEIERGMDV
jgi:hypothetical protein